MQQLEEPNPTHSCKSTYNFQLSKTKLLIVYWWPEALAVPQSIDIHF